MVGYVRIEAKQDEIMFHPDVTWLFWSNVKKPNHSNVKYTISSKIH